MKYKPIEIGDRFGRLTVVEFHHKDKNSFSYFLCKCDCGNFKIIKDRNLKDGRTKSCGCLRRETSVKNGLKNGVINFKKGRGTITTKENKYQYMGDKIKCNTSNNIIFYISRESEWVLKDYCWSINSKGYLIAVIRGSNRKQTLLHRLLMENQLIGKLEVDHINGDKLNNCLDNLRVVTRDQNQWNKKRLKNYGIKKVKNKNGSNVYSVRIGYNAEQLCLGTYSTIEEARKVRDEWEDNHERKEYFRQ